MIRESVSSTSIASIGYDEASQTLEIEFSNGSVYQYYNVPQTIFDELRTSPSVGKFHAYQIKDVFPFSRVG